VEYEHVEKKPEVKAKIANRPWAKKQVKRESE
jgi:hypothetical protein